MNSRLYLFGRLGLCCFRSVISGSFLGVVVEFVIGPGLEVCLGAVSILCLGVIGEDDGFVLALLAVRCS
jgi:hypothetical protein